MTREAILATPLTGEQAAVFYLGQEGVLILHGGQSLVIDPYLSDYVDRTCCTETVRWRRRYPAPLSPEELDFVDYVLCTHPHADHADPDTLSRIAINNHTTVSELCRLNGITPKTTLRIGRKLRVH